MATANSSQNVKSNNEETRGATQRSSSVGRAFTRMFSRSSPENVNVETPDTEEVRMTTVSSTGNLRHLVPPDPVAISAAQQAAAIQQQVAGLGMDIDGSDRPPTSTRSMPMASPQNGFPPQPPQEQTQQPEPSEYTAWIIGSTEAIQKKLANSMGNRSQSAPPWSTTDQLFVQTPCLHRWQVSPSWVSTFGSWGTAGSTSCGEPSCQHALSSPTARIRDLARLGDDWAS